MRRGETIDLRKIGLSRQQWRKLRLEAKALGAPMGIVAEVAVGDYLRRQRRQRKG
jgi:hypothetical protein